MFLRGVGASALSLLFITFVVNLIVTFDFKLRFVSNTYVLDEITYIVSEEIQYKNFQLPS
jgi:hypothetical protein